jgi:Type II secretion system (T2SS), protein M
VTTRDRLALIGISALAVLAVVWLLLVSPERKEASRAAAQVASANTALASAESDAASARAAQARYSDAYASVVALGKAVPSSEEVPSLIWQLAQASNGQKVEFNSITNSSSSASGASSGSPTAATAAQPAGGFTQMPFTFVFNGSFTDLYHLFEQLDDATLRTSSGGLDVSGRLLTLQGVKLEPQTGTGNAKLLTGTITATAYVLPSGTGLTAGATPSSPAAGGSASPAASSASSSSSTSTSAPAAVVTGGPAQ